MKKPSVHVTYHAVVRYLERVLGYDIEAIRRHIGHVADLGIQHGASGVIAGGVCYKLRGKTVVTVVYQNRPNVRFGRVCREGEE